MYDTTTPLQRLKLSPSEQRTLASLTDDTIFAEKRDRDFNKLIRTGLINDQFEITTRGHQMIKIINTSYMKRNLTDEMVMRELRMQNAINVINPYRWEGMWVFDDDRVDLEKEPFVSGADVIIDVLTEGIQNARDGFRLIFATVPFPGHTASLTRTGKEEAGGNWYALEGEEGLEGWLCPALFKYFEVAPEKIYIKAEAKN